MKRRTRDPDDWNRWLDRHLRRLEATGHAEKTLVSRRDLVGRFIAYAKEAGVPKPEHVSRDLLHAYLIYRKETVNSRGRKDRARTINSHVLAVRMFLEYLGREGIVPEYMSSALEYIKEPKTLPKDIPTDKEVRKMLESVNLRRATGFRDRVVLEVLYSTGIRRQELIDLQVGDVDLDQGYLRVEEGKGGKGRVVPLGRIASDWVRRYLLAIRPELIRGKSDPGWLFLTKSGNRLAGTSVRDLVIRSAERAGIKKKITPHALRRACATEMIRGNANPWHVKELLGHEDFRSLDVYTKLTILDLKAAHRKHHPRESENPS